MRFSTSNHRFCNGDFFSKWEPWRLKNVHNHASSTLTWKCTILCSLSRLWRRLWKCWSIRWSNHRLNFRSIKCTTFINISNCNFKIVSLCHGKLLNLERNKWQLIRVNWFVVFFFLSAWEINLNTLLKLCVLLGKNKVWRQKLKIATLIWNFLKYFFLIFSLQ